TSRRTSSSSRALTRPPRRAPEHAPPGTPSRTERKPVHPMATRARRPWIPSQGRRRPPAIGAWADASAAARSRRSPPTRAAAEGPESVRRPLEGVERCEQVPKETDQRFEPLRHLCREPQPFRPLEPELDRLGARAPFLLELARPPRRHPVPGGPQPLLELEQGLGERTAREPRRRDGLGERLPGALQRLERVAESLERPRQRVGKRAAAEDRHQPRRSASTASAVSGSFDAMASTPHVPTRTPAECARRTNGPPTLRRASTLGRTNAWPPSRARASASSGSSARVVRNPVGTAGASRRTAAMERGLNDSTSPGPSKSAV